MKIFYTNSCDTIQLIRAIACSLQSEIITMQKLHETYANICLLYRDVFGNIFLSKIILSSVPNELFISVAHVKAASELPNELKPTPVY